jgi:hypothetical protein
MLSLAAGLPLQWPEGVETMFQSMATISSAGTTLLVPDCELTHMRTADAFYMKQVFFTFVVPIIIVLCVVSWSLIRITCGKRCKVKRYDFKNYTILSIVLMLFLCYPMLAKIALSMLKCVLVGDRRYLMADLQEPCFEGRHLQHVLTLTIPQLLFVVIGLPVLGLLIILRNDSNKFLKYNFRMRYGLLYLGYRKSREWWEVVIAFRKVLIVMIGTFGAMLGVDMQAFLAIFVIFGAIMVHLVGKPFDTTEPKFQLLHQLECAALTLCWLTFWAGLLFFLGHEQPDAVASEVLVFMSIMIVFGNIIFLVFATYEFVKEFIKDFKKKQKERRRSSVAKGHLRDAVRFVGVKVAPAASSSQNRSLFKGPAAPELVLGPTAKRKNTLSGTEVRAWDKGWGL